MRIFKCILIVLLAWYVSGARRISPCPRIFQYKNNGIDDYAIIKIPNPGSGPVILEVLVSVLGQYLDAQGLLSLRKSEEDSKNDILNGLGVDYKLDFPRSRIRPYLTTIKLNDVPICIGSHHYGDDLIWIRNTFTYPDNSISYAPNIEEKARGRQINVRPNTVAQPMYDRRKANFQYARECGVSQVKLEQRPIHTIIGGSPVLPGEYPWLVALYHIENNRTVPKCGATLVTNKHVITAAHCVMTGKLYLELGLHERKRSRDISVIGRSVSRIHTHPDYRHNTGIGDIAILEMDRPVSFTRNIMPACIWPYDVEVYNERGYVAGWGANETGGDFTVVPTQAAVTIMDQKRCRENEVFQGITSDITFCAGGERKGPCIGDSGSGMYYSFRNMWYLRGVISVSISQGAHSCDVSQSSVFADIGKLLTWIKKYID